MAKGLVNESSLNSIAEAINVLNGTEGTYTPSEMGEAIIDAIPTKTASGNPINITDAAAYPAESVVTTLEPVQDLHGYDKPWPAGGGTQMFDLNNIPSERVNKRVSGTGGNLYDATGYSASQDIPVTVGQSYTLTTGIQSYYNWRDSSNALLSGGAWNTGLSKEAPEGAAYLRFDFQANNAGAVMLNVGTTALPWQPYSNICPISGHTGGELTRTGKNLLDTNASGVEVGKAITINGIVINNGWLVSDYIPILLNTAYYYSGVTFYNSSGYTVEFYDKNKTYLSRRPTKTWFQATDTNVKYIRVTWKKNDSPMLETSDSPTTYEPYTPETHSQTFPQEQSPVYGGEVDWANGVLRVTDVNIASYNGETLPSVWISDRDVYAEGATPSIGAQVVYELATPIEIPLTPEVITLLKGENNIWTDAGTSEIEYKVDLQSYIQKLIDEASTTASLTSVNPLSLVKSVEEVDEEKPESEDETGETKKITDDEPADVKELDEAEKGGDIV